MHVPIEADEEALARAVAGAPTSPVDAGLPSDGPARLHRGPRGLAWVASSARVRDEREGHRRGGAHPLAPGLLDASDRALLLPPIRLAPPDDPVAALVEAMPRTIVVATARLDAWLAALAMPIDVPRALARHLGRKRTDRLLAHTLTFRSGEGPTLGGPDPGWLRTREDGRVVCLTMRRAQARGPAALDLAAPDAHGLADLRAVHRTAYDDGADAAYDASLLALLCRESMLGAAATREALAARIDEVAARLEPGASPARVAVAIDAPPWLDVARWSGPEVPIDDARRALRALDGASVGDAVLRVRTRPALRAGRTPPPWGPRSARRRTLFSRWDEGVQADDEGLFSATPEALAMEAARGARGLVLDGTCGVGSLAIALARQPDVRKVVAVDVDEGRLAMARHNASLYGVADRIEFRRADALRAVHEVRADLVVLDPPWGGRAYDRGLVRAADLPFPLESVLAACGPALVKLPRSFDVPSLGPGFRASPAIDARGVLKMLFARRA